MYLLGDAGTTLLTWHFYFGLIIFLWDVFTFRILTCFHRYVLSVSLFARVLQTAGTAAASPLSGLCVPYDARLNERARC